MRLVYLKFEPNFGHLQKNYSYKIIFKIIKQLLEIKTVLLQHDGIKDCSVITYSDHLTGELAFAFIVKADPQLTVDEVTKFVNDHVSREKRLHGGLVFVDEIPRNLSGKILKCKLNKTFTQFSLQSKL